MCKWFTRAYLWSLLREVSVQSSLRISPLSVLVPVHSSYPVHSLPRPRENGDQPLAHLTSRSCCPLSRPANSILPVSRPLSLLLHPPPISPSLPLPLITEQLSSLCPPRHKFDYSIINLLRMTRAEEMRSAFNDHQICGLRILE